MWWRCLLKARLTHNCWQDCKPCPSLHKLGQVLARDRRLDAQLRVRLQTLESLPPDTPAEVWLPTEVPEGTAELLWANMYLHLSPDPEALLRLWQRAGGKFGLVTGRNSHIVNVRAAELGIATEASDDPLKAALALVDQIAARSTPSR